MGWLLDSDPSIRWQVMRDLTATPADVVAAERSRVANEGWGARLLDEQRTDGQWGDGARTPFWWSNMYALVFLRDLGIDPASERAGRAIDLVRDRVTWGPEFGNSPFFEGEVEPCINGRVVALGAYFGERSDRLVDRLLSEQLADGGWNCEAERGSVRSSFHTTICVLEGLLAFEQAFEASTVVTEARKRGEEYLLERRLLRRRSTGAVIQPAWTRPAIGCDRPSAECASAAPGARSSATRRSSRARSSRASTDGCWRSVRISAKPAIVSPTGCFRSS